MEFDFNVNYLFPDIITLVNQDLLRSKQNIERTNQQRLEVFLIFYRVYKKFLDFFYNSKNIDLNVISTKHLNTKN